MFEFFKGWRRKVGVATLVIACVFAAGWVRSFSVIEFILIPAPKSQDAAQLESLLVSWDQCLVVLKEGRTLASPPGYFSSRPYVDINDRLFKSPMVEWKWSRSGFGLAATKGAPSHTLLVAPYWSIVVPLMLLSAYLLLCKPQKAEPKKAAELNPAEGA